MPQHQWCKPNPNPNPNTLFIFGLFQCCLLYTLFEKYFERYIWPKYKQGSSFSDRSRIYVVVKTTMKNFHDQVDRCGLSRKFQPNFLFLNPKQSELFDFIWRNYWFRKSNSYNHVRLGNFIRLIYFTISKQRPYYFKTEGHSTNSIRPLDNFSQNLASKSFYFIFVVRSTNHIDSYKMAI